MKTITSLTLYDSLTVIPTFQANSFIAVEQALHVECKNIVTSIFVLMSIHYVFNIEYHPKIRDLLYYIQEHMFGLKDDTRRSAQYLSFTAAISCYDKNIKIALLQCYLCC